MLDSTAEALHVEAKPKPSFLAGLWVNSLEVTSSSPIICAYSRKVKILDVKHSVMETCCTAHALTSTVHLAQVRKAPDIAQAHSIGDTNE